MRIVGGAVKWINVPAEFRSRSALVPRSLFSRNGMVGKVSCQSFNDEPFRALVRLRDEIDFVSFVANVERARQFFDKYFARLLGDFDRGAKIGVVHPNNITVVAEKSRENKLKHHDCSRKNYCGPVR